MRLEFLCAAMALSAANPAYADALTYLGTIGHEPVVLEITEADDGPLLGRFSRLSDGVDVPVHAVSRDGDDLRLAEELPCSEAACVETEDGTFDPPPGPQWTLKDSGNELTGMWVGEGREFPVTLRLEGSRSYDRYDVFAYQSFVWNSYGEPLSMDNSPYDFLKMQVQLEEGEIVEAADGASYRMVVDPRTRFAFPRVAEPAGESIAAINQTLAEMHWETNLIGFSCLSGHYLSAGWSESFSGGMGTLGAVDEENVSVEYLSPHVMTIVQGGSIFCGGASPWNHIDYATLDVQTGEPFDLGRVFKGWVDGPDDDLIAFLQAQLPEEDYAPECETRARIADFLDISFSGDDVAEFRIYGLDSNELPCEGTFAAISLKDMPELLTPEAATLFPSLR